MPFGTNRGLNYEISLFRTRDTSVPESDNWNYEWNLVIDRFDDEDSRRQLPPPELVTTGDDDEGRTVMISSNGVTGPFVYTREDGTRFEFPAFAVRPARSDFARYALSPASSYLPDGERLTLAMTLDPNP